MRSKHRRVQNRRMRQSGYKNKTEENRVGFSE